MLAIFLFRRHIFIKTKGGKKMKKKKLLDLSSREKIYTFSVGVTGRCNAFCNYCHYYANRNRESVAYDISTEQFIAYMDFIHYWCERIEGITSYRFSGGDPMVLGDRLFELAKIGFQKTGLHPFILTAGKELNKKWVDKAIQSQISHVFVSVENPFRPNKGAPNPFKVVESIKEYNSSQMPIVPGVCVIPNDCFKDLYKICEWFYKELGEIPLICEVNYSTYKTPTDDEWLALEDNLPFVIKDFFPQTKLNLFSSVVPEYAYNGKDPYVFDLNLENTHGITEHNYKSKLDGFIEKLKTVNYPKLDCVKVECPWHEYCQNVKWYWKDNVGQCLNHKIDDYCRFKRIVSDAYYRNLVDSNHPATLCRI
ncbi:MAG: radical SAM protein [Candidatus Paceibacterota bacterium]